MAAVRRPYEIIYLLTIEFLISLLAFYSGAIMVLNSTVSDEATRIENLGPTPVQWLIDNSQQGSLYLGTVFLALSLLTFLLIWGILRAKRFSLNLGLGLSVLGLVLGALSIYLYGSGDFQMMLRFGLCMVLPIFGVYYLTRPAIKKYLQ